ncbi:tetratricopeptide repeat protein, partial [Bathymodiolus thermophilus thioautotrophic gill symbiont]
MFQKLRTFSKNPWFISIVMLPITLLIQQCTQTTEKNPIINNYGASPEQYEQGLNRREKEVTERLQQAHDKEKQLLEVELAKIQVKQNNLHPSYEKYIAELKERIAELEQFKSSNPQLFNKAIGALKQGKNKVADDLFAQVEKNNVYAIKTVAEASFQRANIAEDEIRYADALAHYQKAYRLTPKNTLYLNKLGFIYNILGKYKEAIKYYELALKNGLKVYGEDHPKVATYRNNLGLSWKKLGKYKKAIEYYELALKSDLKTYGEDHPQVAISRNNLGSAWESLGKHKKAIEYYELALKSDLKTYGEDHPKVAIRRNNLGSAWES